ncbi:hypothetical protein [Halorubellus litoreus]|uniref:Uncharacterized protein n=1 Tax=Halorubellus litoreus TaxID=755308 RepID=A0ABD5VMH1_9EURY
MTELTEYETCISRGVKVICPCDWLDDEMPHSVPVSHVLSRGACDRAGASLDGMRLVMNDPDTGAFAQEYRLDRRIETTRKGGEIPYYVALAQCPYDSCDGEMSVNWIESTTGSRAIDRDEHGHCKECSRPIAGVDFRVGTDCVGRLYPV